MYHVVILYAVERQITMLFVDGILSLESKGFVEWQDFAGPRNAGVCCRQSSTEEGPWKTGVCRELYSS